jgi:lactoylglutathione lyase
LLHIHPLEPARAEPSLDYFPAQNWSAGVATLDGGFLDFRDPWGDRIEIVGYDDIQFTKAQHVLRGMGLEQLTKNEKAMEELAKKGMA